MTDKEDKAKRLKEIQERLTEIQKKPLSSKQTESKSTETLKPVIEKKPAATPTSEVKINKDVKTPVSKTEIKTPETKPISPSKPDLKITQEEKNWKSNRLKNETAIKKTSEKTKTKKKISMSKIYTIVSVLVTLIVCSYFFYSFFISNSDQIVESALPKVINDQERVEDEPKDVEDEITDAVTDEDNLKEEEEEIAEEVEEKTEVTPVKAPVVEKNTPRPVKKSKQKPDSPAVKSIVPTGFIISYSSNSTEKIARKNVSDLLNKGFKASYYYMPDKNPASPALYKVYVGPYNDESAAMPDFRKIVDINKGAFILKL